MCRLPVTIAGEQYAVCSGHGHQALNPMMLCCLVTLSQMPAMPFGHQPRLPTLMRDHPHVMRAATWCMQCLHARRLLPCPTQPAAWARWGSSTSCHSCCCLELKPGHEPNSAPCGTERGVSTPPLPHTACLYRQWPTAAGRAQSTHPGAHLAGRTAATAAAAWSPSPGRRQRRRQRWRACRRPEASPPAARRRRWCCAARASLAAQSRR